MKILNLSSLILVLALYSCTNKVDQVTNDISEKLTPDLNIATLENQELFELIKEKDSLLFQLSYNHQIPK